MEHRNAIKHSIELAPADEERCRSYNRAKVNLGVAEFVVLIGTLAFLTFSGAAEWLVAATHHTPLPIWAGDLSYLLAVCLVTRLVLLPFHFFNEHWLEVRY